jgi:hypothetical protein
MTDMKNKMSALKDPTDNVTDIRSARAMRIIRRLMDWMDNAELDEEGLAALTPTCPICTDGMVPNMLNKGPCAYHEAEQFLKKENML